MKIILYGAGSYAYWVIADFKQVHDCEIVGLVDSNPHKQGKTIYGFEVQKPDRLFEADYDGVFISSTIAGVEIYRYLIEQLGIPAQKIMNRFWDAVNPPSVPEAFPKRLRDAYYLYDAQRLYDEFLQGAPAERDPFSDRYIQNELEFFRYITGSPYDVEKEGVMAVDSKEREDAHSWFMIHEKSFEAEEAAALERIDALPAANILELGCAEGLLCEYIAKKYPAADVTGVDISAAGVEYGNTRLARCGALNAKLVCGSVGDFKAEKKYDTVIFHKSFHHIVRHVELLHKLHKITSDDARIYLIKEVICNRYYKPWGINTNYDSIQCIVEKKWLELIFEVSYLMEAFHKTGWELQLNEDLTLDFLVAYKQGKG